MTWLTDIKLGSILVHGVMSLGPPWQPYYFQLQTFCVVQTLCVVEGPRVQLQGFCASTMLGELIWLLLTVQGADRK